MANDVTTVGPVGTAFKAAKSELITWCGIIGMAVTLFDGFDSFIRLSKAAQWFVLHWKEFFSGFWVYLFSLIHISIPKEIAPFFTFLAFLMSITLGARLAYDRVRAAPDYDASQDEDLGHGIGAFGIQVAAVIPALVFYIAQSDGGTFVLLPALLLPLLLFVAMGERRLHRVFMMTVIVTSYLFLVVKQMPSTAYWDWNEVTDRCEFVQLDPGSSLRIVAAMITLLILPTMTVIVPERFVTRRLRHAITALLILLALNYAATVYDQHWPEDAQEETSGRGYHSEIDDYEPGPCDDMELPRRQ